MQHDLSEFGSILLYLLVGIVFIAGGLITAWIVRPHRPNEEKLSTYECGEEPLGHAWGQFNVHFYVVALIFLLFDVEIVFLFPWATVFGDVALSEETNGLWGWYSLLEMLIFVGVLALGLAYAWAKGFLDWVKPQGKADAYESKVPRQLYQQLNEKYSKSA